MRDIESTQVEGYREDTGCGISRVHRLRHSRVHRLRDIESTTVE